MRETQIISLLAEGLTSKEIAAKLGLAKETVDTHRRHLIHKTGCNNTIQLVAYCIHNGLI
jgi:DNA-binding CsgD family transcriptional regulator